MSINIAIANHKGGVGKSTSTMMVAEGLALFHGARVLVLDLDPQGMLSRMMLSSAALDAAARERRTMVDLMRGYVVGQQGALPYFIVPKVSDITELRQASDERRVDLVPSHPQSLNEFRQAEDALRVHFGNRRTDLEFARLLHPDLNRIAGYYDIVLFDCSAGIQPTSLAALRLSSIVLAPTMLERNSINAMVDFLRIILDADLGVEGKVPQQVFVLLTMFMRSNPAQQMLLDTIQRGIPGLNAITNAISHSTAIQRAVLHPGDGASRLAREKYGASFTEWQQLAGSIEGLAQATLRLRQPSNTGVVGSPARPAVPIRAA